MAYNRYNNARRRVGSGRAPTRKTLKRRVYYQCNVPSHSKEKRDKESEPSRVLPPFLLPPAYARRRANRKIDFQRTQRADPRQRRYARRGIARTRAGLIPYAVSGGGGGPMHLHQRPFRPLFY